MQLKLKILGLEYDILVDEEAFNDACEEANFKTDNTFGLHSWFDRKIYIKPGLDKHTFQHTLMHEVLHAIGYLMGNELLVMSRQKNELFVDALANSLVLLLKDNKEFLELFSDEDFDLAKLGIAESTEENTDNEVVGRETK